MEKKVRNFIGISTSFNSALFNLRCVLKVLPQKELLNELGFIAAEMHSMLYRGETIEAVNEILLKRYPDANQSYVNANEANGDIIIVFSPQALRLLHSIIIMNSNNYELPLPIYGVRRGLMIAIGSDGGLPIIGIFRLINQLLYYIDTRESEVAGVSKYYSIYSHDPLAAIGRMIRLYDNPYFNQKLKEMLGVEVRTLAVYLYVIYAHISQKKPARIDINQSFKNLNLNEKELKIIENIMNSISSSFPQFSLVEKHFSINTLYNEYILNEVCRGKPFIKTNNQFICLQVNLMVDIFSDFPYHFLLTKFTTNEVEKNRLQQGCGTIYESYIKTLADDALNTKYTVEKPKDNNAIGDCDLRITINDETILMMEIKAARSSDSVKLGAKAAITERYINILKNYNKKEKNVPNKNNENNYKGFRQLIKHVNAFRARTKFQEDIYTILVFFDGPLSPGMDDLIKSEMNKSLLFQDYAANAKNYSTIWFLNCITAELFFSAIKQGASLEQLLQYLVNTPSSQMLFKLKEFFKANGFKYSAKDIFQPEIVYLTTECEKMFKKKDTQQ